MPSRETENCRPLASYIARSESSCKNYEMSVLRTESIIRRNIEAVTFSDADASRSKIDRNPIKGMYLVLTLTVPCGSISAIISMIRKDAAEKKNWKLCVFAHSAKYFFLNFDTKVFIIVTYSISFEKPTIESKKLEPIVMNAMTSENATKG